MPIPIAGLLSGAAKIAGATRSRGSGAKLAGSIVKRKPKKEEEDSPQESKSSSALAIRPKQSLVPYQNIEPVPPTDGMAAGDKVVVIHTKIIEINNLLKGTLAADKNLIDQRNRQEELEEEKKREEKLEKKDDKEKKPDKNKLNLPKMGIFGAIGNFITNVVLGFILTRLVDHAPKLEGIIKGIASVIEWTSNFVIGFVDGLGSFLAAGLRAYQWAENFLQEKSGEEAVERFHGLTKQLTNLFNAFLIVGSVFAALGLPMGKGNLKKNTKPTVKPRKKLFDKLGKGKPGMKPTGPNRAARLVQKNHGHAARGIYEKAIENGKSPKAAKAAVDKALKKGQIVSKPQTGSLGGTDKGSKITKGGVKKIPKRLATKALGKSGIKAIKGIAKGFGKVPIMGPLIVGVASLLAGEPLGQAVFKGLGAALGGFLGTLIPIPVIGTILGEMIGTLVGDMLYSLTMGGGIEEAGRKFMTAVKSALDFGGLIVNFFKEGFGRFFNDFPTVDVPNFLPFDAIPKAIATVFPFFDKDGDGKVGKIPNLSILYNPVAMITQLIPHAAASFLPDIFGKGGTAFGSSESKAPDNKSTGGTGGGNTGSSNTGGSNTGGQPQNMESQGKAGMDINDKGNGIYLHWTAGNYNSIGGPYHTVFTGDGTMHRKFEYGSSTGGHTYSRNAGSVGLSLAANPNIGQWPTEEQKNSMAEESARIAKAWGWTAGDINIKKVMTHGEAGSNVDGYNAHTNYGPFGRGRSDTDPEKDASSVGAQAGMERWDLDKLYSHDDVYGSGGDEMRERIKGFMRKGGLMTKGTYEVGEEGPEFIIDADSTAALLGKYPGYLSALNRAEGLKSIEVLENYASYENAQTQVIIIEKEPEEEPMEESEGSGMSQFMTSVGQKMEDFTEFLVGQG